MDLAAEGRLVSAQEASAESLAVVVEVSVLEGQQEFLIFHFAVDQEPTWKIPADQVRRLASVLERLVKTLVRLRSASDHLVASLLVVFECHSGTDP